MEGKKKTLYEISEFSTGSESYLSYTPWRLRTKNHNKSKTSSFFLSGSVRYDIHDSTGTNLTFDTKFSCYLQSSCCCTFEQPTAMTFFKSCVKDYIKNILGPSANKKSSETPSALFLLSFCGLRTSCLDVPDNASSRSVIDAQGVTFSL